MQQLQTAQKSITANTLGTLTNGVRGTWRVIAVDGNTLTIENKDNTLHVMSTLRQTFVPITTTH